MRQSWIVTPVIMGLNLTVLAMPRFALAQDMRAPLERTTLPNGLEVIVVENHSVPLAMVLVAVRTGAFTQSEGEQGLAHLFEHVLFRAYGGDPMDFASDASRINAAYNGTTGTDVVTYYLVLPSENTKDAIRLLGRLMSRSRFRARDLEEELPVVLDELARTESDPKAAFQRRLNRQLWRNDWYRRDVIGDSAALASIDLDRLVAAFEEFYIPNNAALIVTGDVDPTEILSEAAKQFEDWKMGPPPFDAGPATVALRPFSESSGLLMSGSVLDVTVKVGLLGPGLATDAPSVYAIDVLSRLLTQIDSPFRRVLVRDGPFQSLTVSYHPSALAGPIIFEGVTTDESAVQAVTMLIEALNELDVYVGMGEEEIAIVHQKRAVQEVLAFEQTATVAPSIASWWAGAGIDAMLDYADHLAAQTPETVEQVMQEYFIGSSKVIGVLGSPMVIQSVSTALRGEQDR